MRSNAAVASASKHSTSVNLGLAANSVAQADYDMAPPRSSRTGLGDLYESSSDDMDDQSIAVNEHLSP